ncbi:MAG: sigma-70 family RNA polymerase sigma factor [Cyclobacteriaceae bacterium]|jgi:RNA polymerase sigma-70 factor (ECF subfamily)|nr:sigma-70 family RNA polymerase sigma factor [Cyclobacteriaceae bacterium]
MHVSQEREFITLIEEHKGIIYKVIRLYVNHDEDERDLMQEILFQAWKSFPRFDGRSKFSTWLYRVALNTVLTFKRRPNLVIPHDNLASLNVSNTEKRSVDDTEALYQAIRGLGDLERMLITLHLDGYENDEIASIIGLTKNHVAVKLHRVKETLMNQLNA